MGRFTEDMRRLREAANQAQLARNQLVVDLNQFKSDLAHNVHHFLDHYQAARLTRAAEDRANRQDFVNNLATEVSQHCETFRHHLTEQVTQLRETIQTNHADMAQRLRTEQTAFIENLTESVNALREQCAIDQQQRQQDFADMAQRERTARDDFVHHLQDTIAQMREELTADRAEASRIWFEMRSPSIHDAKGEIAQSAQSITSSLSQLKSPITPTSTTTKELNKTIKKAQENIMHEGDNFVSGLKTTVSNMMRDFMDDSSAKPNTYTTTPTPKSDKLDN